MTDLKASDAVWLATALLQKEQPDAEFAVPQIVDYVERKHLTTKPRQTIYLHANQHCVANRAPNNARLRMLIETPSGKRRLFHRGDPFHPARANARKLPAPDALPPQFREILDWYRDWDEKHADGGGKFDRLLQLVGSGKHLWADQHADEYVRSLRDDWE